MSDRALRFGVSASVTPDRRAWQELARRYEGDGFDVLVTADHLGGSLAPFSPLVSAADATEHMRVGVLVVNNDLWNPLVLAREAATAALLTDGRFELGLGAGHAREEYEAAGIAYDRPAVRVARLAETVPVLRRLLTGETVDHDGEHCQLRGASLGLSVPGSIPILVGGNGDAALEVAAREADTVGLVGFTSGTGRTHTNLSHFTWAGLAERIAHVRRHSGARTEEPELNVLVQVVARGNRRALAEQLAQRFGQPSDLVTDSPFVCLGSVDDMVKHVERLRSLGVTYLVGFAERGAAELADVIARLR